MKMCTNQGVLFVHNDYWGKKLFKKFFKKVLTFRIVGVII